jgi:gliding motility-associated-like protein
VATVTGDTTVVEGCTNAQFIFSRPQTYINDTLLVNYEIAGDAIMGMDYNNLPNPIQFLPGEDTIVVTLNPTQDGITEAPESVIITATTVTQCGDTILDGPELEITETDPTVYCANDSVLVSAIVTGGGGYPPYTYSWNYGGQTGDTAYVPISQNGSLDYIVTATDACGFTGTDTVTVTMNQTLQIDTMYMFPATACNPDGAVSGVVSGLTGQPLYNWTGPGNPGSFSIDATVLQNIPSGWYYFSVSDNVCSVNDSVFVTQENPPIAQLSGDPLSGCSPVVVTFTNTSQNTSAYQWTFGNGQTASTTDLSSQTQTYTASATAMLVAFQGLCSDTAYVSIVVDICGCTDPSALNYDPAATQDNGSCAYPIPPMPTVEAPNVFTPGPDAVNPLFMLTTTNSESVELTILNRWGNEVFRETGMQPKWDGKAAGTDVPEGVYFYKYTVKGIGGVNTLEGHGYLHLIR